MKGFGDGEGGTKEKWLDFFRFFCEAIEKSIEAGFLLGLISNLAGGFIGQIWGNNMSSKCCD